MATTTTSITDLVDRYFRDENLEELFLNSSRVLVLRYRNQHENVHASPYDDSSSLTHALQDLAYGQGVRLDPLLPKAGGRLIVGGADSRVQLRWHCLIPPVAVDGPIFTARRQHAMGKAEAWPEEYDDVLREMLEGRAPVFFSGRAGSGKSTLLVNLLQRYCHDERVVIVEDVEEVPLISPKWVKILTREPNSDGLGGFDLGASFKEVLRLSPGRLVIGEIRGPEAASLYQAIISGHGAVLTTLHLDDTKLLLPRLAQLGSAISASLWGQVLERTNPYVVHMEHRRIGRIDRWLEVN
jgi:pilus assembly protein CpaF